MDASVTYAVGLTGGRPILLAIWPVAPWRANDSLTLFLKIRYWPPAMALPPWQCPHDTDRSIRAARGSVRSWREGADFHHHH